MNGRLILFALLAAFACAPATREPSVAPELSRAQQPRPPRELLWVRTAAEHEALFQQIFRSAGDRLRSLVGGYPAGTWAVIADADETLIDNSEYQRRLVPTGNVFDSATWNGWVRERRATALPGAIEFSNSVRSLGGHLVVVTNRDQQVCEDTRANIASIGIVAAAILCRTTVSDKNPRFEAVRGGTAALQLGPLNVVMWLGDNIQDFPHLTQQIRSTGDPRLAFFGDRYFVFPNPMYGSFERNALR